MSQRNLIRQPHIPPQARIFRSSHDNPTRRSRQLRFDFGVHDIVADAIGRALAQWFDANRITRSKLADAALQLREARRCRLRRERVRVFLCEVNVQALNFDGGDHRPGDYRARARQGQVGSTADAALGHRNRRFSLSTFGTPTCEKKNGK